MKLVDIPFTKLSPGDIARPWLAVTIINPHAGKPKEINTGNGVTMAYAHTSRIKIADFTIEQTLVDFMPNLAVPLLGMKNFLSKFVLTVDYPNLKFSLECK